MDNHEKQLRKVTLRSLNGQPWSKWRSETVKSLFSANFGRFLWFLGIGIATKWPKLNPKWWGCSFKEPIYWGIHVRWLMGLCLWGPEKRWARRWLIVCHALGLDAFWMRRNRPIWGKSEIERLIPTQRAWNGIAG